MGAISYHYSLGQYEAVLALVQGTMNVGLVKATDVMMDTALKIRACEAMESISSLAQGKSSTSRGEFDVWIKIYDSLK